MTHNKVELLKQYLLTAIKSDDDQITFNKETVKDIYELIYRLEDENELYIRKLKERQAEIERLQSDIKKLRDHNSELIKLSFKFRDKAKTVKTEVLTEFIEKFDGTIDEMKFPLSNVVDKTLLIAKQLVHKIAKEMVGDQE